MDVYSAVAPAAAPFPELERSSLPVDRCSMRDRRRLLDDYIVASRPVVITDAAADWPALRRWTPAFFGERYGSITATVDGAPMSIAEYLSRMLRSTAEDPAPYPYNFDMLQTFPELIADVQPQPLFGRIDRLNHPLLWKRLLQGTRPHELFFGGAGSVFRRLHVDALYLHGHITQIMGEKEFFLYPPEQTPFMYASAENAKISAIDDPLQPDLLRFPLFAMAKPYRTVIRPGETIFFPAGWWHFTRIHGPCISYGGVGLTAANWPLFIRDNYQYRMSAEVPRWKAAALLGYGRVAGRLMELQESLVRALQHPRPMRRFRPAGRGTRSLR